jgi:hypothetical protein
MLSFILNFSPLDGALQLLSTRLKPLSSLATFEAIYGKRSVSLLSSIHQNRTHEETMCRLALFLATDALYVSDPSFLKQFSNTWSRVVRSPIPYKCALVAASLDLGLLVDTPPTLEGASSGGSFLASTKALVAAYIYGIFCSPSFSANSGTPSVPIVGLLRHWVPRSRSGRCCPTSQFCFLMVFVWGTSGCYSGSVVLGLLLFPDSWICD